MEERPARLADDLPAVAVVDELVIGRVPVFRCDTSWFPQRLSIDAEHDGDG